MSFAASGGANGTATSAARSDHTHAVGTEEITDGSIRDEDISSTYKISGNKVEPSWGVDDVTKIEHETLSSAKNMSRTYYHCSEGRVKPIPQRIRFLSAPRMTPMPTGPFWS